MRSNTSAISTSNFKSTNSGSSSSSNNVHQNKCDRPRVNLLMLLLSGLLSSTIASSQSCFGMPSKTGWSLEQENPYAPSGKWTMTLGNAGVKTVDKNISLVIIAPAYNAYVANAATKQYCTATHTEWLQTFFHKHVNEEKLTGKILRPGKKTGQIAGFKVKQNFLCINEFGKERILREVWTTDDIDFPKEYCQILFQLCNLPPGGTGVPLRVSRLLKDGNREVVLNTTKASKIAINKDTFKQPQNYKKGRNPTSVIFSDTGSKDFEDLVGVPLTP